MINPAGLAGQLFLAVDRSGTSTNNNIYVLATVKPTGFNSGTDVMFARSTNGGQTFSTPKRINDDPVNPNKWHWFGTLAVAPNGRIDSVWLDTRNAANNTDSQLFYSYSTDGGDTWSPNVAVSNRVQSFPRLSESEQDGRLHHDRFGQYRSRCRVCRHVQSRGRRLLRSRRSGGNTDTDTQTPTPSTPTPTPTRTTTNSDTESNANTDRNCNTKPDAYDNTDSYANSDTNTGVSGAGRQPLDSYARSDR